jgi:transposase
MAKHRTHSIEFKRQVVQEFLGGESPHALAKRHGISRNLIKIWVAKYEAGGLDSDAAAADVLADYEARIAALERLVGKLAQAGELHQRLHNKEDVTVIDVREPAEFFGALGHIPGARNLPVGELSSRVSELAGRERSSLVLVCRTDKRSATRRPRPRLRMRAVRSLDSSDAPRDSCAKPALHMLLCFAAILFKATSSPEEHCV